MSKKCSLCGRAAETELCLDCVAFLNHLDEVLESPEGRKAVRGKLVEYDKRLTTKNPDIRAERPDRVVGEDFLARLGDAFRKARRDRRETQLEVAGKLGVTHYQLSRWEKGTQLPNLPMFVAWAHVLEQCLSALLAKVGE